MIIIKHLRIQIITFLFALLISQAALAAQANFSWLPNNSSDGTVGYIIHYGISSRFYTESVDVGSPVPVSGRVRATVFNLEPEQTYFFTVTAYNAEGMESPYPNEIALDIPSDAVDSNLYDIYVSESSDLSGALALEGEAVEGDLYIFTGPDAGVSSVIFSVDGVVTNTERVAPFELQVGKAALDTSQMSPGQHEIMANIQLSNGSTKLVSALFTIPSVDDSPANGNSHDIFISKSPNLSGATALEGTTVEGDLYIFTGPDAGVSSVIFSVDGVVTNTERVAPYELQVGKAALDTSQLSPGQHEIMANIKLSDGSTKHVSALFTIPSVDDSPVNDNSHDIFVSISQNLSGAIALEGATAEGYLYIFTGPDAGVSRVIFSVDGVVANTERVAPYELQVGKAALDTSKLSPGQHEIMADIQLTDGSTELVSALFTIPSADDSSANDSYHEIFVSKSENLSRAITLEGATAEGDLYIFTGPDAGVSRVIFSVDGVVTNTERSAPFELEVGKAALDTSQLSPGQHEIMANIQLTDGSTELVSAVFTIPSANTSANDSLYDILVSDSPYLSGATALEGATVGGDIYVFTGPDAGISRVIFSIDGVVTNTEKAAPFELVWGGAAFNTSQLSPGTHEITALIELIDGSSELIGAQFSIE